MKYLYFIIFSLVTAYTLVLIFIYLYQRNLLYHPAENNYLEDKINFNYEEVWIETEKDIKLKSWFIKKDLKKNKTLIFFSGYFLQLYHPVL